MHTNTEGIFPSQSTEKPSRRVPGGKGAHAGESVCDSRGHSRARREPPRRGGITASRHRLLRTVGRSDGQTVGRLGVGSQLGKSRMVLHNRVGWLSSSCRKRWG